MLMSEKAEEKKNKRRTCLDMIIFAIETGTSDRYMAGTIACERHIRHPDFSN